MHVNCSTTNKFEHIGLLFTHFFPYIYYLCTIHCILDGVIHVYCLVFRIFFYLWLRNYKNKDLFTFKLFYLAQNRCTVHNSVIHMFTFHHSLYMHIFSMLIYNESKNPQIVLYQMLSN